MELTPGDRVLHQYSDCVWQCCRYSKEITQSWRRACICGLWLLEHDHPSFEIVDEVYQHYFLLFSILRVFGVKKIQKVFKKNNYSKQNSKRFPTTKRKKAHDVSSTMGARV